jgi:hypothetical protein
MQYALYATLYTTWVPEQAANVQAASPTQLFQSRLANKQTQAAHAEFLNAALLGCGFRNVTNCDLFDGQPFFLESVCRPTFGGAHWYPSLVEPRVELFRRFDSPSRRVGGTARHRMGTKAKPPAAYRRRLCCLYGNDEHSITCRCTNAARSPFWVNNGHRGAAGMSALPPKADIGTQSRNFRFVPKADIVRSMTLDFLGQTIVLISQASDGQSLIIENCFIKIAVDDSSQQSAGEV